MRLIVGIVFLLMLFPHELSAQQAQNPKPCYSLAEYRQFDFWIGEWNVSSKEGQPLGQSKVELILDGCVIFENWYSAQGVYAGKSLNYYDRQSGKWYQKWIDNRGVPIEFSGEYDPDEKTLTYTALTQSANGGEVLNKLRFHMINKNYVNQVWEQSTDEGKSWTTVFDGHYRRKL